MLVRAKRMRLSVRRLGVRGAPAKRGNGWLPSPDEPRSGSLSNPTMKSKSVSGSGPARSDLTMEIILTFEINKSC